MNTSKQERQDKSVKQNPGRRIVEDYFGRLHCDRVQCAGDWLFDGKRWEISHLEMGIIGGM